MPAYIPPPPAEAVIPCAIVPLPVPLTAEALEQWLVQDVLADAECELKRQALVDAWPN